MGSLDDSFLDIPVALHRASVTHSVTSGPEDSKSQLSDQKSFIMTSSYATGSCARNNAFMPSVACFGGENLSVQLGGDPEMQHGDSLFAGASYDPNSSGGGLSAPVPYEKRPPHPWDYPTEYTYDNPGDPHYGQNREVSSAGYVVPIDPERITAWIKACPRSDSQSSMPSTHKDRGNSQSLGLIPERLQPPGYSAGGRCDFPTMEAESREHETELLEENQR
jgi:hypothetical protein